MTPKQYFLKDDWGEGNFRPMSSRNLYYCMGQVWVRRSVEFHLTDWFNE